MATIEERELEAKTRKEERLKSVNEQLKGVMTKLLRKLPPQPWVFLAQEFRAIHTGTVLPDEIDIDSLPSKAEKEKYLIDTKVQLVLQKLLNKLISDWPTDPWLEMASILEGYQDKELVPEKFRP